MNRKKEYDGLQLGKTSEYNQAYCPSILCSIPRKCFSNNRSFGADIWNCYELSWLNDYGVAQSAIGEIIVPASSLNIFESKSLKLYLNSMNNKVFESWQDYSNCVKKDLGSCIKTKLELSLFEINDRQHRSIKNLDQYKSLDHLSTCKLQNRNHKPSVDLLAINNNTCETNDNHAYVFHGFRSFCPVTNQPDWASIFIEFDGKGPSGETLLDYLLSYRNHGAFHEECVERVFADLDRFCLGESLIVSARFLRRGGIDINPYRSRNKIVIKNEFLLRQ